MRWLTLLMSVPATPSRLRVGVWRRLRRMGAVKLKGSAWILPDLPEPRERFQWLAQEIQAFGGEATLLQVEGFVGLAETDVVALFHRERDAEYQAVIERVRELVAGIDRSTRPGGTEAWRDRLAELERDLHAINAVDHLHSPLGDQARRLVAGAGKRLREPKMRAEPRRGARRPLPSPGSTWVTRPRPHIDRVASAWLIKRFIDPDAVFAFADEADAPRKGIPFDVAGAEFTHHAEDCTFETLLKRFRLRARGLSALGEIVHEADLQDGKFPRPEAAGIDLALRGLAEATPDDHELLERGIAIFDGLYALQRGSSGPAAPRRDEE